MKELISAIRQYRHNNANGFVIAYDKEGVDSVVSELARERNELLAQNERLREAASDYLHYTDDSSSPSLYIAARDTLEDALNETPAQSLEAVKAQWQAEEWSETDLSCGVVK